MKRWSIILGVSLVAIWIVVDIVRSLPDAIQYFSARPRELLHVAAIAIGGGLLALGFDRLSPRVKRLVIIFILGALAITMTAFFGSFVFVLFPRAGLLIDSGAGMWVLLAMLISGGLAACGWIQFYRMWKAGLSS